MLNIYLIGFMGSGKSTVGKSLAKELNKSFVDLDEFIEEKYEMKIKEIFEVYGEEGFRQYEKDSLKEVYDYEIIATGGGIVERMENIRVMRKGVIIYLQTNFEEIERRLSKDQSRPLWKQDREKQIELFKRRKEIYENCSHKTVETSHKTINEIVKEIGSYIRYKY